MRIRIWIMPNLLSVAVVDLLSVASVLGLACPVDEALLVAELRGLAVPALAVRDWVSAGSIWAIEPDRGW